MKIVSVTLRASCIEERQGSTRHKTRHTLASLRPKQQFQIK